MKGKETIYRNINPGERNLGIEHQMFISREWDYV